MLTARRMSRSRGRRSPYPCPSFTERVFPDVQRFMHAVEPNVLSFGVDDASSATPVALPPGDPVPSEYLLFVGGLERVQLAAADAFPVPQQWTGVDERELRRALRLLDGQRVRIGGGSAQFVLEAPAPFLRAVGANEKHSLAFDASEPYVANGLRPRAGPWPVYLLRPGRLDRGRTAAWRSGASPQDLCDSRTRPRDRGRSGLVDPGPRTRTRAAR